jgi:hypothetical protein
MLMHEENQRVLLFADRTEGCLDNIQEITDYKAAPMMASPADVLQDLLAQGIFEDDILAIARPTRLGGKPFVIQMYCQVAEDVFGWQPPADGQQSIEVEVA